MAKRDTVEGTIVSDCVMSAQRSARCPLETEYVQIRTVTGRVLTVWCESRATRCLGWGGGMHRKGVWVKINGKIVGDEILYCRLMA